MDQLFREALLKKQIDINFENGYRHDQLPIFQDFGVQLANESGVLISYQDFRDPAGDEAGMGGLFYGAVLAEHAQEIIENLLCFRVIRLLVRNADDELLHFSYSSLALAFGERREKREEMLGILVLPVAVENVHERRDSPGGEDIVFLVDGV